MNQYIRQAQYKKGSVNIIVIIGVIIIAGVAGYLIVNQRTLLHVPIPPPTLSPTPIPPPTPTPTPKTNETTSGEKSIKEKITGDYQWNNIALQTQYSNGLWNKIATNKLAGFSPKAALTERKTADCEGRSGGSYLRTEGGLCGVGYWLEDSNGMRIDSKEKLATRFAPIENEAGAVSFIAVTQGDLRIDTNGIPEGHTLTIGDGFLVQLVHNNTFGCGSHEPTGVIFKISQSGEVLRIASEKQKPPKPGEPVLCAD